MSVETHDLELISDFIEGGYTPVCSCGWEGKRHGALDDAHEEWTDHCDVVFMEATDE